ncbi:MAG: LysM peptidoglycan-binding domain-containing protein [Spirochaetaceae bacterium]
MRKKYCFYFLVFIIVSCTTTKTVETKIITTEITESIKVENIEIIEIIETPENLITEDTIKNYDLTVLKGGSYPTIKNDTAFTETELLILQNSEGLELEANIEVAHYFKYFLRDKKDLLNLWIDNSRETIPFVKQEIISKGLPLELIFLPFLESGYNVNAYSRVGAGGIWQFMPRTATSYGLKINWWTDQRRSPRLATPFAIKHLEYLNNLFGNWYTALAAYNAGEGRIARAMKKVNEYNYFELIKTTALPKETRRYVPQYLAIVKIMKNLDLLGFEPINWDLTNEVSLVKIPGGTDLYELSKNIGISWSEFLKFNPEYRRKVSNPSAYSKIIVPINREDKAIAYLKTAKPITNSGYNYYTVRSGDSWWFLSKLTNTSIISLKRLNNYGSNNLKIGQRLLLPGSRQTNSSAKTTTHTVNYKSSSNNLQTYRVRSGDTISSISIKYNIKLNSLYNENGLNSRSILRIGQIIRLPGYPVQTKSIKTNSPNKIYVVKNGDSVWLIAQKTNVPYQDLLHLNNLNSKSMLNIGDKLRLY